MTFRKHSTLTASTLALVAALGAPAYAAGLLTPTGSAQSLVLADHEVSVVLEDGYAITTIEQRFANPGAAAAEAHYSFPVPDKAAVTAFTYWIDGQPVVGEVVEKETGRQIYDAEQAAGREAAIAEQDAHYAFDMRVTPVPAGGDVMVRLSYVQPAQLEGGIGRYVYPLERQATNEERIAFWDMTDEVAGRFSFEMELRTDYPIEAVRMPAHPGAQTERTEQGWRITLGDGQNLLDLPGGEAMTPALTPASAEADAEWEAIGGAETTLDGGGAARLDTDVVLYWRQAPDQPARVDLVPHKADADGRGTFMVTLTPGLDLAPITDGRDFVFVLDVSGSMGHNLATLGEGVAQALTQLTPQDRFALVTFSDNARDLTDGLVPATPEAVAQWGQRARGLQTEGSTNLYAGLNLAMNALDADRTGAIVLVTDGEANVGTTETQAFLDLVEAQDARLFTAVLGTGANRPLLEPMTQVSGGTAMQVSNADDLQGVLLSAANKVAYQALNDLDVSITAEDGDVRIADLEAEDLRTLYRGEQLSVLGHYWGAGDVTVTLSGEIGGEAVSYETKANLPETATRNPEVERLWAFQAIERRMHEMELLGPTDDTEQSIVDLSVENGVLTPLTAMIAVRPERFAELGIEQRNADRVATEEEAATERAAAPVQSTRVDAAQPMFQAPAPTYAPTRTSGGSGGGSGNIGLIGLILAGLAGLFGAGGAARRGRNQ